VNYKNEAANLIKKLKMLNLAPDERQKCNTQNGAWFCRADSNGLVFMGIIFLIEKYLIFRSSL